jgi:hypothetical protein
MYCNFIMEGKEKLRETGFLVDKEQEGVAEGVAEGEAEGEADRAQGDDDSSSN